MKYTRQNAYTIHTRASENSVRAQRPPARVEWLILATTRNAHTKDEHDRECLLNKLTDMHAVSRTIYSTQRTVQVHSLHDQLPVIKYVGHFCAWPPAPPK